MRINEVFDPNYGIKRKHPQWVFHGTTAGELKILKKKYSPLTDSKVVFGTTHRGIALVMAQHDWTDDDFDFGYTNNGPLILKELKSGNIEKFFGKKSKKSHIYRLDIKFFKNYSGLQDWEMASEVDVPVISEEIVLNNLEEIERCGIKLKYYSK